MVLAFGRGQAATKTLLCLLILMLAATLSLPHSLYRHQSILGFAALVAFATNWVVFSYCIPNPRAWKFCAASLAGVVLLSNIHAVVQFASERDKPLHGTFTNPDCYSFLCLLGIFLCLSLALGLTGQRRAVPALVGLTTAGVLILTGSRSGLVGLSLGYFCCLVCLASRRGSQGRSLAIQLTVLPSLVILLLVAVGEEWHLGRKLNRLQSGQDPVAIKSRTDVVYYGLKTIARYRSFGSGLGCFPQAYQEDRPPLLSGEDYMNVAHNDFIQFFIETGIVGGLAFVGLSLFSFTNLWRARSDQEVGFLVPGQIGLVAGLGAYMLLNPACPVPTLFSWYGAVLGLGNNLALQGKQSAPKRSFLVSAVVVALGLGGLFGASTCYRELRAEKLEHQAEQALKVLDFETAIDFVKKADAQNPGSASRQLLLAEICRDFYALQRKPELKEHEEAAFLEALRRDPRNPSINLKFATFLREAGRLPESLAVLERVDHFAPYSPHIKRALAVTLVTAGKLPEAVQLLSSLSKTGVVIDDQSLAKLIYVMECRQPGYGLKYWKSLEKERCRQVGLEIVQVAVQNGDRAVGREQLKQLLGRFPGDVEMLYEQALLAPSEGQTMTQLEKLRQARTISDNAELEQKVWQKWVELRMRRRDFLLVQTQLEDYLTRHVREQWARVALSQAHLAQGNRSDARVALRAGLPYDRDGSLRLILGDLCVNQGLPDLARTYYKEALPLVSDRKAVEQRLEKLPASDQISVPGDDIP